MYITTIVLKEIISLLKNLKYKYSEVQKSFHNQEPWINVLLLKYITLPLVFLMVNFTRITPNIISILSFTFGMLSAYFYFKNSLILGGVSYMLSYILDATDGKVARIKNIGKIYGAWFDILVDRLNLLFISSAISYNLFILHDSIIFIILNFMFLGIAFIGWESRYNIDIYKLKNKINKIDKIKLSNYEKWCFDRGLIKDPISLPEIFLFYFIFIPHLNFTISLTCIIIIISLLIIRLIKQQLFWVHESNR